MDYVSRAKKQWRRIMRERKRGMFHRMENMQGGEMFVLKILSCSKEKQLTPKQIAEKTCLTSPRVSAILSGLEKKGEVKRETNAENRRQVVVFLTPNGEKRIGSFQEKMDEELRFVFNKMGKEKTEEFLCLMEEFLNYQLEYEEVERE